MMCSKARGRTMVEDDLSDEVDFEQELFLDRLYTLFKKPVIPIILHSPVQL